MKKILKTKGWIESGIGSVMNEEAKTKDDVAQREKTLKKKTWMKKKKRRPGNQEKGKLNTPSSSLGFPSMYP